MDPMSARRLNALPLAFLALASVAPALVTGAAGCAAGSELSTSSATSSASGDVVTSSTTTSSTSSGTGGAPTTTSSTSSTSSTASTSGAGGSGGSGGATTSSTASTTSSTASTTSSTASTTSSTGAGGSDAGPSGVIVLLAGGGTSIFTGEYHPGSGWTTGTLADATSDGPAIALTDTGSAIGLIRSTSGAGSLRSTTWSPGNFSTFSQIAAGVTTRATPSITASGGVSLVAFHGDDFKHYFAAHLTSWAPTAEPIGPSGQQSFGPSPASITAIGSDAIVAFAGNDGDLYDQTRTAGTWAGAHAHGLAGQLSLTPAIITPTMGADLLIAFVRKTDARIVFTTRSGGTWTAPAPIDTNALTNDPVSLAALPNGEAVLAYRGQNGKVYWSRYSPSANPPWTVPAGVTATNYTTPSTPSVAAGVSGADAEMVFVDGATGAANHARLTGTTWSTPAAIGGSGLVRVAIASM
jgi:hypothetical protein